eukprot:TRINITY_DN650_c0_g1_i10.p1 TRINITY_DN650_c0_g1~~TRINITY_DN650_c0_g1_i10.p1  ORF type:complete len:113 (-),score=11.52 TRINITY_DN650_c0_g1_i10:168-506(-)
MTLQPANFVRVLFFFVLYLDAISSFLFPRFFTVACVKRAVPIEVTLEKTARSKLCNPGQLNRKASPIEVTLEKTARSTLCNPSQPDRNPYPIEVTLEKKLSSPKLMDERGDL